MKKLLLCFFLVKQMSLPELPAACPTSVRHECHVMAGLKSRNFLIGAFSSLAAFNSSRLLKLYFFFSSFSATVANIKNLFATVQRKQNPCSTLEKPNKWFCLPFIEKRRGKESIDRCTGDNTKSTVTMSEAGEVDIYR